MDVCEPIVPKTKHDAVSSFIYCGSICKAFPQAKGVSMCGSTWSEDVASPYVQSV